MKEEPKDRLRLVKKLLNIKYQRVALLLNVSEDVAGNYLTGRTAMSIAELVKLAKEYGFDPNWVLTGHGQHPALMQQVTNDPQNVVGEQSIEYEAAKAGRHPVPHFMEDVMDEVIDMMKSLVPATYKAFPIEGTSMVPTIFEGDKLICRSVQISSIENGRVYVIRTSKGDMLKSKSTGLFCKRCYKRDNHITCKSDNKETTDPFFTFQLKMNEITEVWLPVLRLTGNMADPNRDIYERLDEIESRLEMLEQDSDL